MEYEIATVYPGKTEEESKKIKNICSYLEKNITTENLSINGGTLNYKNLTYRSDILLLSTIDGKPIGYASLVFDSDSVYVYQIAINKKYQQKGIGRALITEAIKQAKAMKLDVTANVMEYNTQSKKMFTNLGFVKLDCNEQGNGYYRLYQKKKKHLFW